MFACRVADWREQFKYRIIVRLFYSLLRINNVSMRNQESGKKMNGQLALEFMIVYSIVLVVFVVIFGLVANERSATLGAQEASLMELIAQNVAGGINQALSAGNGYSVSIPLTAGVGTLPYKLFISTTGFISAQTTIGKENITGIATSNARNLVINGAEVSIGNGITLYSTPTYLGDVNFSNIKGTIYVDEPIPSLYSLAGSPILNQKASLKLPYFSGSNSMITAFGSSNSNLEITKNFTLEAWVYLLPQSNQYYPIAGEFGSSAQPFILAVSDNVPVLQINGLNEKAFANASLTQGGWYDLAATYNGTDASLYIDGVPSGENAIANPPTGVANFNIGAAPYSASFFTGYIADVQFYNTSLNQSQLKNIYAAGPTANPKNKLSKLRGWWPLNGNSNDYSGYATPTAQEGLVYQTAIDLNVETPSLAGSGLAGVPLAISSINDTLGGSNSLAISSNYGGSQSTLITSNSPNEKATVQVLPFEGNLSTALNLGGWWPLDMGNSTVIPDFSGNGNSGNFVNGNYFRPNSTTNFLVSQFNGQSSYINGTGIYAFPISNFEWVYPVNYGTSNFQVISEWIGQSYQLGLSTSGNLAIWNGANRYNGPVVPLDKWSLVGFYLNNTVAILYVNGEKESFSASGTLNFPSSATSWIVGWQNCCGNRHFNGSMANIEVYNGLISNNAYQQLYNEGVTGTPLQNYNLTGWWPLSGTVENFAESSAQYDATPNNITYNSIDYNGIVQTNQTELPVFNGNTAYVSIPTSNSIDPIGNFTVIAWANPRAYNLSGGLMCIVCKWGQTASKDEYFTSLGSSGQLFVAIGNGIDEDGHVSNQTAPINSWTQVGLEYNISSGGGTEYGIINGRRFIMSKDSGGSSVPLTPVPLGIGAELGTGTPFRFFNGSIIGVQVYNSTLTPAQIEQLYLQGLPVPESMNVSLG